MTGTLVTVRPVSQGGATGWTLGGAPPTVWQALSDDNAATYAMGSGWPNTAWVSLGQVAGVPAGAQIRSVTPRVKVSGDSTVASAYSMAFVSGLTNRTYWVARGAWAGAVTTRSFGGVNKAPSGGPWTIAEVNNLMVGLVAAGTTAHFVELYVDVLYNQQPTVTVTGPSGSVTGSTPAVTWSFADPDGDAQERAIIRIFTDTAVNADGFNPDKTQATSDSGEVFTAGYKYTLPKRLQPGTWWVYVKVADTGSSGRYSLWSSSQFSIAGSQPATPTLISAAADSTGRRNVLTVQQSDNLLGYNQAGLEDLTNGPGWYSDTNATVTVGTSTATNAEGTQVLRVAAPAAALSRVRGGGVWTTAGFGLSQNLALHPSSPPRVGNIGTTTLTTAAFTPPVGAVLLAAMSEDAKVAPTPTISSSPALTWTKVVQSDFGTSGKRDAAVIWRSSPTVSAVAHTVSLTHIDSRHRSLQVVVMTGVHATPIGASGTGSTTGTIAASYTSTGPGSWGFLAYADWANQPGPAVSPGVIVAGWTHDAAYTGALIRRASSTSQTATAVPLTTTAPASGVEANWAYVEVMPVASVATQALTALAGVPVTAGATYTKLGSAWVTSNVSRTARIDYEWYDATGTIIGALTTGATVATSTGSLLVETSEDIVAPANAVCCVLLPAVSNPAINEIAHWDRLGLLLGAGQKWSRGGMQAANLLDTDDGSLQGTIGTWVIPPGDTWSNVSRVANATVKSGQVLQAYATAVPHTAGAWTGSQPGIEPGASYTFSAMALAAAGTPYGWVFLRFEDADGLPLSETSGPAVSFGTTAWQLLSVTAVAPPGAVNFRCHVGAWITTTGAGNAVWWTRMALIPGTVPMPVWQPGPAPNTYPHCEFSDDAGVSWQTVRNDTLANYDPTSRQATVYDYEAPGGAARSYRVSTAGIDWGLDPLGNSLLQSAPTDPTPVTLPGLDWWLKDPQNPGVMLNLDIQGDLKWSRHRRQGSFSPLGASRPIVTFDAAEGRVLTQDVWITTQADFDLFESLLAGGQVLLLQGDMGQQWYVTIDPDTSFTMVNSPTRLSGSPLYMVSLVLTEVDRP